MGRTAWIGADPGGKCNLGVAAIEPGGTIRTWCVGCVEEAVNLVMEQGLTPLGVGVDAPLWWSAGPAGNRAADLWLRKNYGLSSNNVQSVNSMWGAVLVQGVLFVERLRQVFPDLRVTEAHPKVALRACGGTWESFSSMYATCADCPTEHERDAVIAAVAAREGFDGRWSHDLSLERLTSEQDPAKHWIGPVHYFWPE